MPGQKLTETTQAATVKNGANFLITQLEGAAGSEVESVRRATMSKVVAALKANGLSSAAEVAEMKDAIGDTPMGTTAKTVTGAIAEHEALKVNKPATSPNGVNGQLLRTNGDGTTDWVDVGQPTDEQTAEAVSAWLDDHPEATTTVEDGAITFAKLNSDVENTLAIIAPLDDGGHTHTLSDKGRSFKVAGNSFENETVKIYNSSTFILSPEHFRTQEKGGLTTKPSASGVNIDGTVTSTYIDILRLGPYADSDRPLLPADMLGENVIFRFVSDKSFTLAEKYNDTPTKIILDLSGSSYITLELENGQEQTLDVSVEKERLPDDQRPFGMRFENIPQGSDFDDVNINLIIYRKSATITDTEVKLNDGEKQEFEIPASCETVVDTGLHKSIYTGIVNTKSYVISELPYVTPEMYGAVGDGITDCTAALQNWLNDAFDSGKTAYLPRGTYCHTGLSFPAMSGSNETRYPKVQGADQFNAVLKHTGSGVGVTIEPRTGAGNIFGIDVSGIKFEGNSNTTIGLKISDGSYVRIQGVRVVNASQSCIEMVSVWLSYFEDIYLRPNSAAGSGFIMTGGNCTHNTINKIYVFEPKTKGFELHGTASIIGELACDGAEGLVVYQITGWIGGYIGSLAFENPKTDYGVLLHMSQTTIGAIGPYNVHTTEAFEALISANKSYARINLIKCSNETPPDIETINYPFFKLLYANLIVGEITGNVKYSPFINPGSDDSSSIEFSDGFMSGTILRARSVRPYIGTDKARVDSTLIDKSTFGNAIFLDCTGEARYKSDGTDCRYNTDVKEGDWFIESSPSTYGVAGYVIRQDVTTDLNKINTKEAPIPLILSGPSTDRPEYPFSGMSYFDTTLGAPIWYSGSAWVDATGSAVT